MSKLTEILGLFCYDPETDGANTFNIPKALNENWEKIDQLVLLAVAAAAAYDPEGSYAVGDYCTHGGGLHKCNTPIPSGEPWNAEHWTETTVADELVKIIISLSNKVNGIVTLSAEDDLNNITTSGFYRLRETKLNVPDGCTYGTLIVCGDGNTAMQLISDHVNDKFFKRAFRNGAAWSDWISVNTSDPPQVRSFTLQSGFSTNGDCTFFVTQESTVFLAGGVSGTLPANQDTQIGTLQADVRPTYQCRRPAVTNAGAAYIDIHTDGTVWAHPFAAASQCWFDTSFVAGGGS